MRIPFGTISVTPKAKRLISGILKSNRLSSGKYVREFEQKFASLVGVKEAVAVSSGTDADALALAVLYDFGARRGDEIIIPALSFMATANAVLQAGFTPVCVDIELASLNIDPQKIGKALTQKTRAIMPVHLMGKPADMGSIFKIAKKHKLWVIPDAAEAHGAAYRKKNVAGLGDMVAYSLYVAHIISTIEGGIITTDRADLAEILRSLRSHGRACKCSSCVLNTASQYCPRRFGNNDEDIRFKFERVGFSAKMNEIEAAVGIGNLDTCQKILSRRRENLYYLLSKFGKFAPDLFTITKEPYEEIGPHAFPFVVGTRARFKRNELTLYLEKKGIDTRTLFISMPTQCKGMEFLGYKTGDFPNAEYIGRAGLHIGVHQDMAKKECDYFLSCVEAFLCGR